MEEQEEWCALGTLEQGQTFTVLLYSCIALKASALGSFDNTCE